MTDLDSATRPRVARDHDVLGRWVVTHRGHIYPFPSWRRAIEAASDPGQLCRYTCICPTRRREAIR